MVRVTTTTRGGPIARSFAVTRERATGRITDIRTFVGGFRGGTTTRFTPTQAQQFAIEQERKRQVQISRARELIKKSKKGLAALSKPEKVELASIIKKIDVSRISTGVSFAPVSRKQASQEIKRQGLENEARLITSQGQAIDLRKEALVARQQVLERLSRTGLLQTGVALNFNKQIEQLNKDVKSFNEKAKQTQKKISSFKEPIKARTVKEEGVKPRPTTFIEAGKPPGLIPEQQRRVLEQIESGIFFGGQRLTEIPIKIGAGIEQAIPPSAKQPIREAVLGLRLGTFGQVPVGQMLFGELLAGKAPSAKELRKRVALLGGTAAEVGTVFLPGGIGTARRVQAALTAGTLQDAALGFLFGGVARGARATSQFAKLLVPSGRPQQAFRVGEQVVGKGLIPAIVGAQAVSTGAELRAAAGREQEVKRIGRLTAGGFASFLLGAGAGARVTEQFVIPVEAGLARQAALRKLPLREQQKFKEFFEIAKEIKPPVIKDPSLRTQRLTAKQSKIVRDFFEQNKRELILFGSNAIVAQTPTRIGRTIKPDDIDFASRTPEQTGRLLAEFLRQKGVQRISTLRKGGGIVITKAGVKIIEVKPESRLIQNIGTVRSPFELPSQSIVTSPKGLRLLSLTVQEKRAVIAGLLEDPKLRVKDIERFERIARILTPKQIATARAKARKQPIIKRTRTELQRLLGEQAGELFPISKALKPLEPIRFFGEPLGKPSVVRRRRGGISFLPSVSRPRVGVSKLPKPNGSSRLLFGQSKLPQIVSSFLPSTKKTIFSVSKLPPISVSKLPPITTIKTSPSRLPPVTPSRLPAIQPVIIPPFTISKLPPVEPISILPPVRPAKIPPTKPPFLFAPEFEGIEFFRKERKQGFNVFIRKRGKNVRVNKVALEELTARGLGFLLADESVRRSGFIRPTKKKPKRVRVLEAQAQLLAFKFRRPKGKTKLARDSFVEKTAFAIDSPQELQGITLKGRIASERNRAIRKVLKLPKKRKRKRKFKKETRFFAF